MVRFPLFGTLAFVLLAACAGGSTGSSASGSPQQHLCEAERETARAEAGFRLQATGTGALGSAEAAFAQDMQDAQVANDIAAAAFDECMAGP